MINFLIAMIKKCTKSKIYLLGKTNRSKETNGFRINFNQAESMTGCVLAVLHTEYVRHIGWKLRAKSRDHCEQHD